MELFPDFCGLIFDNAYEEKERFNYFSSRAATPGRTLPSKSSREAPPPVEMWLIFSARPAFSTAATESPPPIMVVQPEPVKVARVSATANVPLANASHSKTPRGPCKSGKR